MVVLLQFLSRQVSVLFATVGIGRMYIPPDIEAAGRSCQSAVMRQVQGAGLVGSVVQRICWQNALKGGGERCVCAFGGVNWREC